MGPPAYPSAKIMLDPGATLKNWYTDTTQTDTTQTGHNPDRHNLDSHNPDRDIT